MFSRKTLPSIINFPLVTFYISIIYVIAKLFRTAMVPISAAVFINDSPFPEDVLMLCETIILYRLKGRLDDEEELFFLLIDIMRSPQVLKAICGDSTKTLEKQLKWEEKQEKDREAKEAKWRGMAERQVGVLDQQYSAQVEQHPTQNSGSRRQASVRKNSLRSLF